MPDDSAVPDDADVSDAGASGPISVSVEAVDGAEITGVDADGLVPADGEELEAVWDLSGYGADELDGLDAAIERAGIERSWESDTDLVVLDRDAARVQLLIERLDNPLALPPQADGPEGEEAESAMSALMLAAGRLRKDPGDIRGIEELMAAVDLALVVETPFGFAPDDWAKLIRLASRVRSEAVSIRPDGETVRTLSGQLYGALRPLV